VQIIVPPIQEDIQQLTDIVGHEIENILYFVDGSLGVITKDNLTQQQQAAVVAAVQQHLIRPCILKGSFSERPTAKANGRLWFAEDTKILYRDNGTTWDTIGITEWEDIISKPDTFPPEAHDIVDHDTDATGTQLNALVGGGEITLHSHAGGGGMEQHGNEYHYPDFSEAIHDHDAEYSDIGHNHDGTYETPAGAQTKVDTHANLTTTAHGGILLFSGVTKISVGTSQPGTPSSGDLWVDTN